MLNLATMKHHIGAEYIENIEAQRLSADYIGGGGGVEQIDMDGDDSDDRAQEMIVFSRKIENDTTFPRRFEKLSETSNMRSTEQNIRT